MEFLAFQGLIASMIWHFEASFADLFVFDTLNTDLGFDLCFKALLGLLGPSLALYCAYPLNCGLSLLILKF